MWSNKLLLTTIASLLLQTNAHTPYQYSQALRARIYVTQSTVADSYDFVIAGGGLAGLVIASRLTEDPNTTVLVLEAGATGDAVGDSINPPVGTYYNSLVGTSYDWQHVTTPQQNAAGRTIRWPRGKVLGGSTAINGMYYVRPSDIEVEAWKGMLNSDNAAGLWGWDNLYAAMKKSETFTPPTPDVETTGNIQFNAQSYGAAGPLHVSYPGFMLSVVGNWTPSLEAIGIATAADPANGKNFGGFVSAVSINPTNWTRAYSKSAYIDPLPPRSNLDILVSATVTRIIFNGNNTSGDQIASGVEFATSATGTKNTVKVNKEVIVTGGALGSPNVLMHSGVGPKDVLDAAGVPVVVNLPGVGQHLQDHLAAPVVWQSKVETAGDIHASNSAFSKQAQTMSFINSAIAYINASTLFDNVAEFEAGIANAFNTSVQSLVHSQSSEVIDGYKAIYSATQNFVTQGVGLIELLLSINAPGSITIQAALQHPYSQGRVYINSSSAFDPIVIDPQYFSHPADVVVMREGIKLVRQLGSAAPISNALGAETFPGPGVSSDQDIETWLAGIVSTEFHPQATCSMLPRSQGGVVNANLQVYGLANVRVADSSVFPLSFSAHLAAPTYGLAETAAEIIKNAYKAPIISNNTAGPASQTNPSKGKNNALAFATWSKKETILATIALAGIIMLVC
ncbi:hypothetical protein H0H81_008644 [Sphagnurus paluster]|uniref:Glucose-methanol-choline oxidoreductase N-terminal domain-containing protein n=1 Tax=Sphagnurus paluster TaxID=117069 RepID=A0A9P7GLE1_9AGAR|nr:hypothetical protein H0H81_008644 [Sphagnurus paluster]